MNKLPRNIKPLRLIKFLIKYGFRKGKGKGSHIRLTHSDGHWTQVAVHPGPVPAGTLRKIIKQTGLSDDQLKDLK
ncbi:type II toxin-antitoxin system HicA family toxin [Candidatus Daviesbacteria bacterium]|nr:type II toxin-antitoxin system HicA family toxin [Candidatus Daviesbacteria bacterium]